VLYSGAGDLDLGVPIFNTPDLRVVVVTTERGARRLRSNGSEARRVTLLVAAGEERIDPAGLLHAHQRLFTDFGVRYLDCEGGAVILAGLRAAGLLDEIFVTASDVEVDASRHEDIKRLFPIESRGARLIAEGGTQADPGYVFRRWRFNER
jgi:riboflavin biosynthesis pyrimidine reductase